MLGFSVAVTLAAADWQPDMAAARDRPASKDEGVILSLGEIMVGCEGWHGYLRRRAARRKLGNFLVDKVS